MLNVRQSRFYPLVYVDLVFSSLVLPFFVRLCMYLGVSGFDLTLTQIERSARLLVKTGRGRGLAPERSCHLLGKHIA